MLSILTPDQKKAQICLPLAPPDEFTPLSNPKPNLRTNPAKSSRALLSLLEAAEITPKSCKPTVDITDLEIGESVPGVDDTVWYCSILVCASSTREYLFAVIASTLASRLYVKANVNSSQLTLPLTNVRMFSPSCLARIVGTSNNATTGKASTRIWRKDHTASKAAKKSAGKARRKKTKDEVAAYAGLRVETLKKARAGCVESAKMLVPSWFVKKEPRWFVLDADGQLPLCVECGEGPWESEGVYNCRVTHCPHHHHAYFDDMCA